MSGLTLIDVRTRAMDVRACATDFQTAALMPVSATDFRPVPLMPLTSQVVRAYHQIAANGALCGV
jgi:hypothetical protein